ncbi:pentapeptide repeat-containing protein [endosymbiont of Acanthamoeba sp. UWC8]|uniref:pentapeptide repeat-containing protein n=1 Tax=endosymbiont of Acanthamoeba sp. UWC8 TaxID=86106 RepID=UPI0004D1350C|nr:pentapeptide repeat-containing protein [endosymbiont of Acanthamoeba sp. UWC8]AIF81442.1 pentapeptide repeat-containing protein [endosymbiont of Acanthamoeba sp. UWC8]
MDKDFLKRNAYKFLYFLYDKLCIRFIVEKFHPSINNARSPSTFLLWFLSIYIGLFGIAYVRYEHKINRLENRLNIISFQADTENWKRYFKKISSLQRTLIPYPPSIDKPITLLYSLLPSKDTYDLEVISELQDLIVSKKAELSGMMLNKLILIDVNDDTYYTKPNKYKYGRLFERDFIRSNFSKSWLDEVKFSYIDFAHSNFDNASLHKAGLNRCNFEYSSFYQASLISSDLSYANLQSTNMHSSVLMGADLRGAILIGANLYNTYDLDKARLKGAWYNSNEFQFPRDLVADIEIEEFCMRRMNEDICAFRISDFPYGILGNATVFPEEFKPEDHGMIDAYKIIEMIKKEQTEK